MQKKLSCRQISRRDQRDSKCIVRETSDPETLYSVPHIRRPIRYNLIQIEKIVYRGDSKLLIRESS